MRLSEAIRLGSLAIPNPRAEDITSCALGMACKAIGELTLRSTVSNNWPWAQMEIHDPRFLARLVPVRERYTGWGPLQSNYGNVLATLFNEDVMSKRMTIEALCDQVRAWEDELAAKGVNVEQVTLAAELTEPASPTQSIEKESAGEAK